LEDAANNDQQVADIDELCGFEDADERGPVNGTFSRRLAIAFAAVAAITALLAALLNSAFWNRQFDQYLRDNLQRISDGVAQVAAEAYSAYGGWTIQTLSTIPRFGPARGIGVQILDPGGAIIYDDAAAYRQQNRAASGDEGTDDQQTFYLKPEGPVASSQVVVQGHTVGSVRVWAYGAGAVLTDRDRQFQQGSFMALTLAAVIAIAFASAAGFAYAQHLVKPIARITAAAQALRAGDRDARTGMDGNDEIAVLGKTFDEMADAIEADRELERRLTADVAHELRTPLQAIQATVEAMQDGVLPADEEHLETVRNETLRLGRLADGILELTRLERGSLPFVTRRIRAAAPVRAAVDAHSALVEAAELTLTTDFDDSLVVIGDSDRIQQAAGNLLSNAVRYTPAGGAIHVSVRRQDRRALIEVSDTGVGISVEDMARVFSRFWRADSARHTATGGIGIGLSVTKEIVERHRGTIAASPREGGGTTFTISLPLV
jgi:signal transduction histidine kinase